MSLDSFDLYDWEQVEQTVEWMKQRKLPLPDYFTTGCAYETLKLEWENDRPTIFHVNEEDDAAWWSRFSPDMALDWLTAEILRKIGPCSDAYGARLAHHLGSEKFHLVVQSVYDEVLEERKETV